MEFRVLGPLEVFSNGRPLDLHRGKERALLSVLLLDANRLASFDRIATALWDDPPIAAIPNIRTYVSALRRALPTRDHRLRTEPSGYSIRATPAELDLLAFEDLTVRGQAALTRGDSIGALPILEKAVRLWRGPPLQDVSLTSRWAPRLAAVEERYWAAHTNWIDARLAVGEDLEVLARLTDALSERPLCERTWAQLMVALYRASRQADALTAFSRARRTLIEQVGVEPGPLLQQVRRAILDADPRLEESGHILLRGCLSSTAVPPAWK